MIHRLKRISLFLLALYTYNVAAQTKQRKALFIIADGIPADVVQKANTPFLDSIAAIGAFIPAYVGGEKGYSEMPTVSAPGYNNLLTGTWAYKHNVFDNNIPNANYNYWTIFRIVREVAPEKKLAVFSTWLDNRTKLIGDGLEQTGRLKMDYHFDGMELDTVAYPHDKQGEFYQKIDEDVASRAADFVREKAPDISWVYLEYTDEMGHRHGDSPQLIRAVELVDAQIGRIWQAIKYRMAKYPEDWVIYITTDHGRDAKTGHNHGGQSDRERNTWIVTNSPDLNLSTTGHKAAIVDIMPSIMRFMKLEIPRDQKMEIDGVSITGKLSADSPNLQVEDSVLKVSWNVLDPNGIAKVWLSTTNNFAKGNKDQYSLVARVLVKDGKASVNLKEYPSRFYKVVIELPLNMLNRRISLTSSAN